MRIFKELRQIFKPKELIFIISLSILIRILIMPFFFHPDIKTYHFQSSFLQSGVFNIYEYLDQNKNNLPFKEEFVYFPLTYFFLGGYQLLISPILSSDFTKWLYDAGQSGVLNPGIFKYLFFLKLPYLILDLLIGVLLIKLFSDMAKKRKVFLIWVFNPLSILVIYIFSNVDILPLLFSILSLILARNNKWVLSGVAIGVGAGFKAYPLLFLPFLILSAPTVRSKILTIISCFGTLILIIAPFISSQSFLNSTLNSGLMNRITELQINIGFGESILLGILGLGGLFFYGLSRSSVNKNNLWKYYLSSFLIIFGLIHYHIQWLLWIAPLLIVAAVVRERSITLLRFLIFFGLAIPFLYEDKFMSISLFQPISVYFNLLPIPFGVLNRIYEPYLAQSILHSLLLVAGLVFIVDLLKDEEYE